MGQAKVSNLEVTIVRRVMASADNQYIGRIDTVMPTDIHVSFEFVETVGSNTQEVHLVLRRHIPSCHEY